MIAPDLTVHLETETLVGDELTLHSIDGWDRISELFCFEIQATLAPGARLDVVDLLGNPASLVFRWRDEEVQRLSGAIGAVREVADALTANPVIEFTLVPRAFVTAMRTTLDVFIELTLSELLEQCLDKSGMRKADDFDLDGIVTTYPTREFVVQYKESDLAFLSRQCEHHGVFFFFDHQGGEDLMVFGDHNAVFPEVTRTPEVALTPEARPGVHSDRITSVRVDHRPLPRRYVVRDYNYRTPGVDLLAEAEVDPRGRGEVIEYGAHFKSPTEGRRIAELRAEELRTQQRVWTGEGVAPSFTAGTKFVLAQHPTGDVRLLLTAVRHRWRRAGDDDSGGYRTEFRAITSDTPYRPERRTPKPKVAGLLTGIVEASDSGPYADVDDQGRYRVRFLFDTADRGQAQASRPVRMAQPHAGDGYGMHFPLRAGVEVLLNCVDGDPDRPIIVGTAPNPATASPVADGNRERNVIRTGGGNEINISDEGGLERIKMTTPHANTLLQLGAPNAAQDGALMKTSASIVSNATDTIAHGAETYSAITDVWSAITGKNQTSVAGVPTITFDDIAKVSSAALGTAIGVIDAAKNANEFQAQRLEAQEEVRRLEAEALGDSAEQESPETRTAGGAQIQESPEEQSARRANAAVAKSGDSERAKAIESARNRAEALAVLSTAASTTKSALKGAAKIATLSDMHKAFFKQVDTLSFVEAQTAVASFGMAGVRAARGRTSPHLGAPSKHYNLVASTNSVVTNGLQKNFMIGGMQSTVIAGRAATLVSPFQVGLYGGVVAEVAATRTLITGTATVDVKSRAKLKMQSTGDTLHRAGGRMQIHSVGALRLRTDDKLAVAVAKSAEAKVTKKAALRAGELSIVTTDGGGVLDLKTDLQANVGSALKANVKGELKLKTDEKFTIEGPQGGVKSHRSTSKLWLGSSQVVLGQSRASLKSNDVAVNAQRVMLRGRTINLG